MTLADFHAAVREALYEVHCTGFQTGVSVSEAHVNRVEVEWTVYAKVREEGRPLFFRGSDPATLIATLKRAIRASSTTVPPPALDAVGEPPKGAA